MKSPEVDERDEKKKIKNITTENCSSKKKRYNIEHIINI